MVAIVSSPNKLSDRSTDELKQELLNLTEDRDHDPLKEKVLFHQVELTPYFEELNRRNPFPDPEEQIPLVLGIWTPVWSTIPFHDILPGRIHDQSYQVFRENGYYANMARYAPGQQFSFVQKISSFLVAYDLMVMQKFAVRDGQWCIQNVGIEQALRKRETALTMDDAENWFSTVLEARLQKQDDSPELPPSFNLEKLDRKTVKKFEKTYLATPKFEHLYVDEDLRIVKTQREAKQRPSYTIARRRR